MDRPNMDTPNRVTITVHSRPGGGGSGGGGPNKATWTQPEPAHLMGLNSILVFGSNFQAACPLNFQMAVGSNVQICINPSAFQTLYLDSGADTAGGVVNTMLGSGLGGNMQLTMGTSANFVIGQSFDINLGPRRITLDVHNKSGIQSCVGTFGTVILVAVVVFLIAYPACSDDDGRAVIVMLFQALMQLLLMALMNIQAIYTAMDASYKTALNANFATDPNPPGTLGDTFDGNTVMGGIIAAALLLGVFFLPFIMDSIGESQLSSQPATQTYDVVDSSGGQTGDHVTI